MRRAPALVGGPSALALLAAAAASVACAVWMATTYGLHTLFADQWRIFHTLLTSPFPLGLLESQNGHRPVIPNLIHYINAFVLHRDQTSVMWLGFAIALACCGALAWFILRSGDLPLQQRVVLASLSVMAVLHTSNGPILYHSNDSIHSYLVLLPLLLGLGLLARDGLPAGSGYAASPRGTARLAAGLSALALVGLFSFGTGAVLFPTFLVIAVLARAPARLVIVLFLAGAGATAIYLFALPEASAQAAMQQDGPRELLTALPMLPRWAGAPLAQMISDGFYLQWLDAAAREELSHLLQYWICPILFLTGFVHASALTLAVLFGRRSLTAAEGVFLGLVIAMVAVGVLVTFNRYFLWLALPHDVFSWRYYAWSSMLWLGIVALAYLGLSRAAPRAAVSLALVYGAVMFCSLATAPAREDLAETAWHSTSNSLHSAMGIHPGAYWKWLEITSAEQILFVGHELKKRGIPLFDPVVDRVFNEPLGEVRRVPAPPLAAQIVARRTETVSGTWYAELETRLEGGPQRVLLLSPGGRIKGFLVPDPRDDSAALMLARAETRSRAYFGYISNYARRHCYRYAIEVEPGVFAVGPLTLVHPEHVDSCGGR